MTLFRKRLGSLQTNAVGGAGDQNCFFHHVPLVKLWKHFIGQAPHCVFDIRSIEPQVQSDVVDTDQLDQSQIINQISNFSNQNETVYLCDPYFLRFLQSEEGYVFFIKLAESLGGRKLRLLCGHLNDIETSKVLTGLERKGNTSIFSGIQIKAIGEMTTQGIRNIIHNRWIASSNAYFTISNSLNSVNQDGAIMQKANSKHYFTTSEYFWSLTEENTSYKIETKSF